MDIHHGTIEDQDYMTILSVVSLLVGALEGYLAYIIYNHIILRLWAKVKSKKNRA